MLGVSTNVGGATARALISLRKALDTQVSEGSQFNGKKQFGKQHCIFGKKIKSIINDASHENLHYGRLEGLREEYRDYMPFLDVIYTNIHKCMLLAMGQHDITPSAEAFVKMQRSRPHEEKEGRVQTHTRIKDTDTNSTSEPTSGSNSGVEAASTGRTVAEAAEEEKRGESEDEQMEDDNNDEGPEHRDHRNTPFGVNRHQVLFPMHASPHSACH
jgi:hypothetical protein